jgi:cysteine synthase A
MRWTSAVSGRNVGGSTGTNMWGAAELIAEMRARGERGSVVTLICDGGERYAGTYGSDAWLAGQGLDIAPFLAALDGFLKTGEMPAIP